MPKKKSNVTYIHLQDGSQVMVEMTHQSEPMPTPNEVPMERELTLDEYHEAVSALSRAENFLTSRY